MKTTRQISSICLVLVFLALSACKPPVYNTVPIGAPGTIAPAVEEDYKINIDDRLSIKLFYNPELNQDVVVRPDGRITLQLVNEVKVVGMTPAKLSEVLAESYSKYLAQPPEINVIVNSVSGHKIFVGGEVGGAGLKELTGPTTVLNAILLAGGFRDSADRNQVVLVRRDENNKAIYMKLDIEKAMKGLDPSQDIYLQPYDIVVVPRSGIADFDLWIDQYLGHIFGLASPFGYYFINR